MRFTAAFMASLLPVLAYAHDGVTHGSEAEAAAHQAEAAVANLPLGAPTELPFDLGGQFELVDHTGSARSEADPDGHSQLLFFGYANCPSICAVAMPMMAELTDALLTDGFKVRPVMVTIDPERDTVANMGPELEKLHKDFVGLTGSDDQLAHVYDLFQISREKVFDDPEYGAVYAHGSHIYLLDDQGKVLTLIPPILGVERAQKIVANYLDSDISQ